MTIDVAVGADDDATGRVRGIDKDLRRPDRTRAERAEANCF